MKIVPIALTLGLGMAQVLSGTGAVAFDDDASWAGGVGPLSAAASLITEMTIATNAQVTVSSTPQVSLKPLNLGDVATNTSLIIANGVTFTVNGLKWTNGEINLGTDSKFQLGLLSTFGATLYAGVTANQRKVVGTSTTSEFALGTTTANTVDVSGGLGIDTVTVKGNGGKFTLNSGATLQFTNNNIVGSTLTIDGSGDAQIVGKVDATSTSLSITKATVTGELTASGNMGTININGAVSVSGSGKVGGNAAQVNVAQAGALTFATTGTSVQGSTFDIAGKVEVAAGATVTVTNPTEFKGAGSLNVSGTLKADAGVIFTGNAEVGGTLQIGSVSNGVEADVSPGGMVVVKGGTFDIEGSSTVIVGTGSGSVGTVQFSGSSTWQRGEFTLNTKGELQVTSGTCTVNNDASVIGNGNAVVKTDGNLLVKAKLGLSNAKTTVSGNFSLDANADVTVNVDSTLEVNNGGRLRLAAAGGRVTINNGAMLTFVGSSSIEGPRIDIDGSVTVQAGAQATVRGSSTTELRGNGNCTVAGHFRLEATADVRPAIKVLANGVLSVAAKVQADFTNVTLSAGAKASVAFAADGTFTTVRVNETLDLSGQLEVVVPDKEPTSIVVLIRAARIQGDFSATAVVTSSTSMGRRLLASGTVVKNGNTVEYHPGTTDSASKAEYFFGFSAIAAALWL